METKTFGIIVAGLAAYIGGLWWYDRYDNPHNPPPVVNITDEIGRVAPTYRERLADYEACAQKIGCNHAEYQASLEGLAAQAWPRMVEGLIRTWVDTERSRKEQMLFLASLARTGGTCAPVFAYHVAPGFHIDPQVTGFKCP